MVNQRFARVYNLISTENTSAIPNSLPTTSKPFNSYTERRKSPPPPNPQPQRLQRQNPHSLPRKREAAEAEKREEEEKLAQFEQLGELFTHSPYPVDTFRDVYPYSPNNAARIYRKYHSRQWAYSAATEDLTSEELKYLHESWDEIQARSNLKEFGTSMFITMFGMNRGAMDYFKWLHDYKDIEDLEDLRSNARLREHALRVIKSIDIMLDDIHNDAVLNHCALHVARIHKKIHLPDVVLELLVHAFSATMAEALERKQFGMGFKDKVQETIGAWAKFLFKITLK